MPKLYENNPSLPIFRSENAPCYTNEIVGIILEETFSQDLVATMTPLRVMQNASFLIDWTKIGHWKDPLSDMLGHWNHTKTKRFFFDAKNPKSIKIIDQNNYGDEGTFVARRYINTHRENRDFHRVFLTLEDSKANIVPLMYIQYYFDREEHPISVILPHGNDKTKNPAPFQSTKASVRQKIKTAPKSEARRQIFSRIFDEAGGFDNIKGFGDHPRNRNQISNLRRDNDRDETTEILDLSKEQWRNPPTAFVHHISSGTEKTVFLANLRQLKDVERFCTQPQSFSVLGVDPTFNIGNFYVTVTTYRYLMLYTNKGVHPVMIGPILIHHKKGFDSYFQLPSGMVRYDKELVNIKCFGTDGEVNVSEALQSVFTGGYHLLCDIHMRDNIEKKMSELGIAGDAKSNIINDIFGEVVEDLKIKGLVDCWDAAELNTMFSEKAKIWRQIAGKGEAFVTYFEQHKLPLIANCMTAKVRTVAGLGYPPDVYTQNANECINSVLKRAAKGKKLSLREAALTIDSSVREQENQVKLAMIGIGELKVAQDYSQFSIPHEQFYSMNASQRDKALKRFNEAKISPADVQVRENANAESLANRHNAAEPPEDTLHHTSPGRLCSLSVCPEESGIVYPPFTIVQEIFQDASSLARSNNNIVIAPGCSANDAYFVSNPQDRLQPFVVTVQNVTVKCQQEKCVKYAAYKICSHSVAIAEYLGILAEFVANFNRLNRYNLSCLTDIDQPKTAGKKATKATQRRKGAANKPRQQPRAYKSSGSSSTPVPSPAAAVQRPALIAPPATGQQSNTAVLPMSTPAPGKAEVAVISL